MDRKKTALVKYLETHRDSYDEMMVAYLAQLDEVAKVSPLVASHIVGELRNQRSRIKLIASENYSTASCHLAMGNLLTDKYSEGFAYHRYYAGCENVDAIEDYACRKACEVFGAEHAYVQPHSGADANLCAYWAIINTVVQTPTLESMGVKNVADLTRGQWDEIRRLTGNQRLMGLDYSCGGHLTHGYRLNVSAQMFDSYSYGVDRDTGLMDYDAIERQAMEVKPLILLAGYSAYPRKIDFRRMREIADKCGAVLMVDMAHFAGLVAGKVFTGDYDPVKWADVVTTTTHKTLRGPRGGMILCKERFAEAVDQSCPAVLGGPLPHVMAAKAVALTEAGTQRFSDYAHSVVRNARALAEGFIAEGLRLQTGGTDDHLMLVDVTTFGLNGRQAENVLLDCGVICNRNALPYDENGPWYTSGLRIGTPAVTSLGMDEDDMREIASIVASALRGSRPARITKGEKAGTLSRSKAITDDEVKSKALGRVNALLSRHVLYPELDLDFLEDCFRDAE